MKRLVLVCVVALLAGSAAHSQTYRTGLKWGPAPPGLPKGARLAVLAGNPSMPGMFTIQLRFPAGYTIRPHRHPTEERVTVVNGGLWFGMGARGSWSRMRFLGRGATTVAPANQNHYAFTARGATIQVTARGPFQIVYANPAHDPRNRR